MRDVRDQYLPPDHDAFVGSEPPTGRVIVIAPTRAACETIELAVGLHIETYLEKHFGGLAGRTIVIIGLVQGVGMGFVPAENLVGRARFVLASWGWTAADPPHSFEVIDSFADSYASGETPVPCIECNQSIKFHDLLATARDLVAEEFDQVAGDCVGCFVRRCEGQIAVGRFGLDDRHDPVRALAERHLDQDRGTHGNGSGPVPEPRQKSRMVSRYWSFHSTHGGGNSPTR